MMVWIAVLLVGAGSYTFRLAPLLLGDRLRLGERTQELLRHAGMGGMAALLLAGLGAGTSDATGPATSWPALAAVGVAAVAALRGRSMITVLLAGGTCFAAASLVVALMA